MMSFAEQVPLVSPEQAELQKRRANSADGTLWDLLDQVKDPEIPAISLWELGVLRDIQRQGDSIKVVITPTYSGCPAMETMSADIHTVLTQAGFTQVTIEMSLSPAWTTDWMSSEAREKLHNYGIAPPQQNLDAVSCPHCKSDRVEQVSEFGSTACKALYRCLDCAGPFDYFKQI